MKNLFILKEDYKSFKKGIIMQKGSDVTEEGIEYFDVTTEVNTGECYSDYNIPDELLDANVSKEDYEKVNEHFKF
jgi:hypothetical protein